MGEMGKDARAGSLAVMVLRLTRGGQCPFCGSSLERVGPARQAEGDGSERAWTWSDRSGLKCPDCGLEVMEAEYEEDDRVSGCESAAA